MSDYSKPIPTEKFLFVGSLTHYKHSHLRLPFIVTKFENDTPYCEVHAMTPQGEAWLGGQLGDDVTLLYRKIVKQIYGMDPMSWNRAGGRIKAPSGSTWDDSLEWLPTASGESYALSLGKTEESE